MQGDKLCGIPHEQPVEFTGTSITGSSTHNGFFTISYGKYPNGKRHTELIKPTILVDGVDFGTKGTPEGWNPYLNQCGGTGYFSFKNNLELTGSGKGSGKEHYLYGPYEYDSSKTYAYVFRNMPAFIDSINKAGFDFIFLDFPRGAADMRANAGVLVKLIDIINNQTCNSVPANCVRTMDNLIVSGASMGGQVARYALTYMEKTGIKHHTKQYIAFDSPHLGANVPIGLQVMMTTMRRFNLFSLLQINDMLKRKFNSVASKQLKLLHYEKDPYYGNSGSIVYALPSPMRTSFVNDLVALGNWPKKCEKIAIANGSSDGTKISYVKEADIILDMRTDFLGIMRKTDNLAQQTCRRVKNKTGGKKALQVLGCGGAIILKVLVHAINPIPGKGLFTSTAYCMDNVTGSTIAKVAPLVTRFFTRYTLQFINLNQKVLDNVAGSGNDGLGAASVGVIRTGYRNHIPRKLLTLAWVPGAFFTFIPTTSALALNTQNVANFQTKDFGGNETDIVNNGSDIRFTWANFNQTHPTKTVFDRVFFNDNINEQHVEISYNSKDRELSKISQFLHVARTAQQYWPNGNTPPAPDVRVLGYATGTTVMHYNFDTLVTETGYRKSKLQNNVQDKITVNAHIINANGYLGINEYAPPGMFDTKASNSYIYANLPTGGLNKGNLYLKLRNWQNQNYQLSGCSYITVNNLGKLAIGDKDSTIRYKANTIVKKGTSITLNPGGILNVNDNSTLTFENGSTFNYNGGKIVLNGTNARLVINAGANIILAPGTTFTVAGGSNGIGKIVFNSEPALKQTIIQCLGNNKLKLKGNNINQTLVNINDCVVVFNVDSALLTKMQITYTNDNAKLHIANAVVLGTTTSFKGVNALGATALQISRPKLVVMDKCKATELGTVYLIGQDPKMLSIVKIITNNFSNCTNGISQTGGGISVYNTNITNINTNNSNTAVNIQIASLNNNFVGNTIKGYANAGIVCKGAQSINNYFENNVIDCNNYASSSGLIIDGCNNAVFYCNTIRNSYNGLFAINLSSIIAEVSLANYLSYSGYNKFTNNKYHINYNNINNLYLSNGYNTFGPIKPNGFVILGATYNGLVPIIANNNKWSVSPNVSLIVFNNQFSLFKPASGTFYSLLDANRLPNPTDCGSMNPPNGGRLACPTCNSINTANFFATPSNVATDSVITAITDTARTNTNYVSTASQGSQIVNYNYPNTSNVRQNELVTQAHKYQQLAHAMAISVGQTTASSNYSNPITTTTIADIETVLATAQAKSDSQAIASQYLSKVQALYVAQQYTQALSYVTSIKANITPSWLPHLNTWECIVQNAYALSTGAITMEVYTNNLNNCDGSATHRKRGGTTTDEQATADASSSLFDDATNLGNTLLIHPNPVTAGATLTITSEEVSKFILRTAHNTKLIEYVNHTQLTTLEFTAPEVSGVYWLEVYFNNTAPKRYKVVVQ
jgi:hypothetical protein